METVRDPFWGESVLAPLLAEVRPEEIKLFPTSDRFRNRTRVYTTFIRLLGAYASGRPWYQYVVIDPSPLERDEWVREAGDYLEVAPGITLTGDLDRPAIYGIADEIRDLVTEYLRRLPPEKRAEYRVLRPIDRS